MDDLASDSPSWIDLESVKPLSVAVQITSLSTDTIKRRYSDYIVQLSPRREGMTLRNILKIARGGK
jgi:hypothetical protein